MTLEEAITHLEKSIYRNEFSCEACKQEHEQLLAWLQDYKVLRGQVEYIKSITERAISRNKTADSKTNQVSEEK